MRAPALPTPDRAAGRLGRDFFSRPSPVVARELLGSWLVRRWQGGTRRVRVIETEAYLGSDDPASHAFRGQTSRNAPMFGRAGVAYVYFIYGMHHCFNVVTGAPGDPQAVLLRGAMAQTPGLRLQGPGLLCRELHIDLGDNGVDLCGANGGALWLEPGAAPGSVLVTPRIRVRDPRPLRFRTPPH